MTSGKRRTTLKEVARQLGLSPTTISAVLRNRAADLRLAPATVQKVQETARRMGYVPNLAAVGLRAQALRSQQVILAVITSFEAPVALVSQAIRGLRKVVDERQGEGVQYVVTVEMFHAGRLNELPGLLDRTRFNGALIANTIPEDDKFLAEAFLPYPVVLIGRNIPGYSAVLEKPGVGQEAAQALLSGGRSRLAVLHPRLVTQTIVGRLRSFLEGAARTTGYSTDTVVAADMSERAGFEAIAKYLSDGARPDGLFCTNDSLAVGACFAIRRAGLRIPEDLGVIGVGDAEAAAFMDPPLSTIGVSQTALHEEATRLLLQQMDGRLARPTQAIIPFGVRLRESSGHRE